MPTTFGFYRLVLRSHLGSAWSAALPAVEFAVKFDPGDVPITEMKLRVSDQAELIGLLTDLHARGLQILSLSYLAENLRDD